MLPCLRHSGISNKCRKETGRVIPEQQYIVEGREKHPSTVSGCFFVFARHEGIYPLQEIKPQSQREETMKVVVQDNQIEKAIRDLKKKLTKEGFFSEIKERRFYDKPSVQKKKKMAKAAKRRRKRMRKFN
jgi:small subunit ribosomal protein S21